MHKRVTRRSKRSKRSTRKQRKQRKQRTKGGDYTTATVKTVEGIPQTNHAVVSGPMGVMSEAEYRQQVDNMDRQGADD
jgi:3-phosphoglycerate kinase